jgi:hypothetical protein
MQIRWDTGLFDNLYRVKSGFHKNITSIPLGLERQSYRSAGRISNFRVPAKKVSARSPALAFSQSISEKVFNE